MRILTAGESHGVYEVAILEGFPKGVKINESFINSELKRRMSGAGRGKRMLLEKDTVAKWEEGAYLLAGNLWFCLILDKETRKGPLSEYTHFAFSI